MNDKIKETVASLRTDVEGSIGPEEQVLVYKNELRAVLDYMEARAAEDELLTGGLDVGDRVESRNDVDTLFGMVPKGSVGTLYQIRDAQTRHYPFCVKTDDGVDVAYQRHEIRKAR